MGFGLAYFFFNQSTQKSSPKILKSLVTSLGMRKNQIIGFLPYWLVDKADKNYSQYLTNLTYFGLTINPDGTIQKLLNPTEEEPGWYSLRSGRLKGLFSSAKENNLDLSLLVFSGNEEAIANLISNPSSHAANLINDVAPLMREDGFNELNLDIESFKPDASDSARDNFVDFVRSVREKMEEKKLGALTIDVSPTDLVKKRMIDVSRIAKYVDRVVFMAYDYHFLGSLVTGAVSPSNGAGIDAEFDVETGLQKAVEILPREKIFLGIPLYGYEWETIDNRPRSAILPGSGLVISNRRAEELLNSCATCSALLDESAKESYLIYEDQTTGTVHQVFFPDEFFIKEKLKLAQTYEIGGVALWAIGYEGNNILKPLIDYKNTLE